MAFDFNAQIAALNQVVISAFKIQIVVHSYSGDKVVSAIFDDPSINPQLQHGGFISDRGAYIDVLSSDAGDFEKGTELTVTGDLYTVISPPEHDGAGMCRVHLGRVHVEQSKPNIRY